MAEPIFSYRWRPKRSKDTELWLDPDEVDIAVHPGVVLGDLNALLRVAQAAEAWRDCDGIDGPAEADAASALMAAVDEWRRSRGQ